MKRAKQFLVTFLYDDERTRWPNDDFPWTVKTLLESAAKSQTDGDIPCVQVLPLVDTCIENDSQS